MIYRQILNMVDIGIVVLDRELYIHTWNRWIAHHSGRNAASMTDQHIFAIYPHLDTPRFRRNCKSVLRFGNFCFFSHKLHQYLFPLRPVGTYRSHFDHMPQSCTMGPLYDDHKQVSHLYIAVHDVSESVAYQQKLMRLNTRDPLTGIANRRLLEQRLEQEFIRCSRYQRPLSLIMLDIDHFKQVNDEHGHPCGDQVLLATADRIQDNLRHSDLLARYGGEEFCIVLPETNGDETYEVAERIRQQIQDLPVHYQNKCLHITISGGIASLSQGFQQAQQMLDSADQNLYAAKKTGRNQIAGA